MGNTFVQMLDIPGELAKGATDAVETGGEDALFGPQARNFFSDPLPTLAIPAMGVVHNIANNTLLPKQQAVGNPLSTANQYQARFGVSSNHF